MPLDLTSPHDDPPRLWTLHFEMPLVRRVMRLGTGVMLATITQFCVNYFDTLMVGHLDGPTATASQAALGLGMPLFWAVGGFFAALGIGTQAMTARRYAEGEHARAGQVLYNALLLSIVAGLVGGAIGYTITPAGIGALASASEEQERLGVIYTQIRMLGVPGMVVTFGYKAFFDGVGRTYVHLWAALAMNFANILLNWLLIFGNDTLGVPRLELAGAAVASVISTYVGMMIMIGTSWVKHTRDIYQFYRPGLLDWSIISRIVRLMLPSGTATVILMTGFGLFMYFVGRIDYQIGDGTSTYTAATKAIMDTTALAYMPLIAFGTAAATCVSQSLGAGKPNLAARYGWEACRIAIAAMVVMGAVFFAIPEQIIGLLAPNDPAVPAAAATSLRITVCALPMMAVGLILAQALYGAGANMFVAVAEFALHFGFLVPVTWLLGPYLGFGMEGVWTAAALYASLLGLVMAVKFLGPGWRKIRL